MSITDDDQLNELEARHLSQPRSGRAIATNADVLDLIAELRREREKVTAWQRFARAHVNCSVDRAVHSGRNGYDDWQCTHNMLEPGFIDKIREHG